MNDFLPGLPDVITASPLLSHLLTVGAQSLFLLAVFLFADLLARKYWPDIHQVASHTLWQSAFLMLALLPVSPFLSAELQRVLPDAGLVSPVFEAVVQSTGAAQSAGSGISNAVVTLYSILALTLLLRLGLACLRLRRMIRSANPVLNSTLHRELAVVKTRLGMRRWVILAVSPDVDSPVSFGFRPAYVMLPPRCNEWSPDVLTDVLIHELCHIRRNDWLMLMASHVLCALYWFNPLVWLARRQLLTHTENRCDRDVLLSGRDHVTYAESLLSVARSCRFRQQRDVVLDIPAQPMFERKTLKNRLSHVLEETAMKNMNSAGKVRQAMAGGAVFSLLMMAVLVFNPVLLAQDGGHQPDPENRRVDQELMPLHTEEPVYPEEASVNDIEGWVQVRFTISGEGAVVADSVSVVDAEPAGVFEESARAAIQEFRFQPLVVYGEPLSVPNVQYVFRYDLGE